MPWRHSPDAPESLRSSIYGGDGGGDGGSGAAGGGAFTLQMHLLDEVQPPVFVPSALNLSRGKNEV